MIQNIWLNGLYRNNIQIIKYILSFLLFKESQTYNPT